MTLSRLYRYFSTRTPLLVVTMLLGIAAAALHPQLKGRTSADFRQSLAQAICEEVNSEDSGLDCGEAQASWIHSLSWSPSQGQFSDFVWGRSLFCSLRLGISQSHDVYRVMIGITPDGSLSNLKRAFNLTATQLADEKDLALGKHYLAFSTNSSDHKMLSLIALRDAHPATADADFFEAFNISLHRFLVFGGINETTRADLFIPNSFRELRLREVNGGLELTLDNADFAIERLFAAEQQTVSMVETVASARRHPKAPPQQLTAQIQKPGAIPWFDLGADFGRKYLGNSFISWLEGRTFAFDDQLHQLTEAKAISTEFTAADQPALSLQNHREWPPSPLSSRWKEQEESKEGQWEPSGAPLVQAPPGEFPLFYETTIRPDPERSGSTLHLVAMDMSRLELGMRAGYEDPHPTTGPPGSGHMPLETEVHQNIVATFNGAFKTTHGQFGMKAEKRLLVPPRMGAATIFVDDAGNSQLGSYQSTDSVVEFESFRQNLELLIEGDRLLPSGRKNWGEHLYGTDIASPRSGLCGRSDGTLIYAFSDRITASSLAQGMQSAGCTAGMHLDMNPGHCAFIFQKVQSVNPLRAEGQPLTAKMKVNPTRYVKWSPKDFFYLRHRRELQNFGDLKLSPFRGKQPEPLSIPGIFIGTKQIAHLKFRVIALDSNRFQFIAHAGQQEGNHALQKLGETERARALLRLGLGHRTHGRKPGLIIGENRLIAPNRTDANLLIDRTGNLSLLPPGREGQVDEHLIQLPLLARNGVMNADARSLGGFKVRSALCLLDDGLLVYGELASDSVAPLVDFMTKAGCSLVVSTDRGSQSKPSLEFIQDEEWLELPPLGAAGKKPEGATQLWMLESGLPSTFSVRSGQTEAFELAD